MGKGKLFVVSGFSGSGKGTIMKWFKERDNYAISISCTSRLPRNGEAEGIDYYFISHEELLKRKEEGYFLENAVYVDHAYGTPADFVKENIEAGKCVILEIEMQGALQVKKVYPDTPLVFITPPSAEELKRRLINRKSETEEEIKKRLSRAAVEAEFMDQYDYVLVNDDLDLCTKQLNALMQEDLEKSSCHLVANNIELVKRIQEEVKQFKQE